MTKSFLILIFCFQSLALFSQKSTPIDSIRFYLESDQRIYTYLKVNDKDSLYFLFDTGASDMVISSESLHKLSMDFNSSVSNLGATGENSVELSENNKVQWGDQRVDNLDFISISYPTSKWDGVLGLSLMKKFTIRIDYDTMLIYLYEKKTYKHKRGTKKLKFSYQHNVPFIEVDIQTADDKTHTLQLEVDTGSDRIIDISTSYVHKSNLLEIYPSSFAVSRVQSSDGNSGKILNNYFSKVSIADYELYKIPGGLAQIEFGMMNIQGVDGIIGNWFLKRFNLTFDFENNYLYLEANNNLHTAYYRFLTN